MIVEVLNLYGDVAQQIETGLSHAWAGKYCDEPEVYYAKHFLRCYTRAAYLNSYRPNDASALTDDLTHGCQSYFIGCFHKSERNEICAPMITRYQQDTALLGQAVKDAALASVANYSGKSARTGGCNAITDAEESAIESRCEDSLRKAFPVTGDAETADCAPPAQPRFGGVLTYEAPCHDAAISEQQRRFKVCAAQLDIANSPGIAGITCRSNMTKRPDGSCGCQMTERWDGERCLRTPRNFNVGNSRTTTCMSNMSLQADGKCGCPIDSVWNGTRCIPSTTKLTAAPPINGFGNRFRYIPLLRCVASRPVGEFPHCCPIGTHYEDGACRYSRSSILPALTPPQPSLFNPRQVRISPPATNFLKNVPTKVTGGTNGVQNLPSNGTKGVQTKVFAAKPVTTFGQNSTSKTASPPAKAFKNLHAIGKAKTTSVQSSAPQAPKPFYKITRRKNHSATPYGGCANCNKKFVPPG